MTVRAVHPAALAVYNAALDAALDRRIALHRLRSAGDLDVPTYKAGLRAVRDVERALEPLRARPHSRAYELSTSEQEAGSRE